MAYRIRRVEYFYAQVKDRPGEAYKILSLLADLGVNLLAFNAVPIGPKRTQLTMFPEDSHKLEHEAKKSGLSLDGPHSAILVQGDDELGALAGIHAKLFQENINIFASNGVTDGTGSFGYIVYVRQEDYERAAKALEL